MFAEKLCSLSDEELVSRYCDTRNHKAFQEIYLRYKDELFRYCAQMVPRHCTQLMEVFWYGFLETPPQLQRRRLKNWLYIRLNRLLRNPSTFTFEADTAGQEYLENSAGEPPGKSLSEALESSDILRAIQQLPMAQRNVFLLFTECGLSLATVADIERSTLASCRQVLQESRDSIEQALYGSARKPWKSAATLAKEVEAQRSEELAQKNAAKQRTDKAKPEPRTTLPWGKSPKIAAASPATADRSVEVA